MGDEPASSRCVIIILLTLILITPVICNPSPSPSPTVNPHAQSLLEKTLITSYLSFHREKRHTAPRLIYRYNGTQPGFGNRISNLFTAFTLASLSRRVLIIDWREPYDLFTFFDPRLNLKYSSEDEDKHEKVCSSVACKSSLLAAVLPKRHRTITYPAGLPHADMRLVLGLLRKHTDLPASKALKEILDQSLSQAKFFKTMFDSLVTPGKELSHLLSVHSADVKPAYVAVHARLGSGLHEFGPRWGHKTPKTLAECFSRHARTFGDKLNVKRYYLATDTISFRPLFERELRERGGSVMQVGKVEPVHTRDCATHPRGCLQAVFEFMILSKAKGIIASKSTFSQVAGFVGGVEKFEMILDGDC